MRGEYPHGHLRVLGLVRADVLAALAGPAQVRGAFLGNGADTAPDSVGPSAHMPDVVNIDRVMLAPIARRTITSVVPTSLHFGDGRYFVMGFLYQSESM